MPSSTIDCYYSQLPSEWFFEFNKKSNLFFSVFVDDSSRAIFNSSLSIYCLGNYAHSITFVISDISGTHSTKTQFLIATKRGAEFNVNEVI